MNYFRTTNKNSSRSQCIATITQKTTLTHQTRKIKPFFIIAIFSISLIVAYGLAIVDNLPIVNAQTQGNKSSSSQSSSSQTSQTPIDCNSLPPKVSKNAAPLQNPNKDVCDMVIMRQAPQIIGHNGTLLNKFLAINSMAEITPASANMSTTGTSNSSDPVVIAMGEFGLLQTELKPMLLALSNANWNVTAVHNHPILEKPPMIFVHWDTMGPLSIVTDHLKSIVAQNEQLQLQSSQGQQQNSSSSTNPLAQLGKTIGGALGMGGNK